MQHIIVLEVKRMKRIYSFIFVFLVVLLVLVNAKSLKTCSAAVTYLPGVASGQFLHYSMNMTTTGNDTELTSHMQQLQGLGNVTVLNVSGVNVTFHTLFYNATTNQTNTFILDIENCLQNGSSTPVFPSFFLAANLSEGDPIYVGAAYYLNQTVVADYLGEQLETNHMVLTHNQTNANVYGYVANTTQTMQCYWERRTGILLDFRQEGEANRSDGMGGVLVTHFQWRILGLVAIPSPPVIPEFPSILILPIFMIATLLAVTIYKKRAR